MNKGNRDAGKLNAGWPSTSDTGKSRGHGTKKPRVRSLQGTSVNSEMHAQRIEFWVDLSIFELELV